jgi:hypothetical protein
MASRNAAAIEADDAISQLKADHRRVEALFRQFESARDEATQQQLAEEICRELTIHATLEEEIFYPSVRAALPDEGDLVFEAVLEHGSLKMLIGNLEGLEPGDELFKPSLSVMKEYVEHHVKEEETEMFPKFERAGMDLEAIGEEMQERREQLLGEL